jgi:hypothetical protein
MPATRARAADGALGRASFEGTRRQRPPHASARASLPLGRSRQSTPSMRPTRADRIRSVGGCARGIAMVRAHRVARARRRRSGAPRSDPASATDARGGSARGASRASTRSLPASAPPDRGTRHGQSPARPHLRVACVGAAPELGVRRHGLSACVVGKRDRRFDDPEIKRPRLVARAASGAQIHHTVREPTRSLLDSRAA